MMKCQVDVARRNSTEKDPPSSAVKGLSTTSRRRVPSTRGQDKKQLMLHVSRSLSASPQMVGVVVSLERLHAASPGAACPTELPSAAAVRSGVGFEVAVDNGSMSCQAAMVAEISKTALR